MSAIDHLSQQATTLWDMLGSRMPRRILGLSDPDVHYVDDRWVMFIGGFSTSFRNRLYRATAPRGADPADGKWQISPRPVVSDPGPGDWDAGGMHTPSYVPAHHGRPPLLFYAGRASRRHYGPGSSYSIGLLHQRPDGAWDRQPTPVLTGWDDRRRSVLEPLVVPIETGYRMWFLAAPHEVGPGEQPDFQLHVTDSVDGVSWSRPALFATREEGFFDNAVYPTASGWEMLLARGTNLHGTDPYPDQGLWIMRAASPSPIRSDWTEPARVLDTDAPGTPAWMARGVCGPSVAVRTDGSRVAFFTGTHDATGWVRAARTRLRGARRLPVPAPYFLATGQSALISGETDRPRPTVGGTAGPGPGGPCG